MSDDILPVSAEDRSPEVIIAEVPHPRRKVAGLPSGVRTALALGLCLIAALCRLSSPDAAQKLSRWIVGDGGERVLQAFVSMDRTVDGGEGLAEAWSAFCRELDDETA